MATTTTKTTTTTTATLPGGAVVTTETVTTITSPEEQQKGANQKKSMAFKGNDELQFPGGDAEDANDAEESVDVLARASNVYSSQARVSLPVLIAGDVRPSEAGSARATRSSFLGSLDEAANKPVKKTLEKIEESQKSQVVCSLGQISNDYLNKALGPHCSRKIVNFRFDGVGNVEGIAAMSARMTLEYGPEIEDADPKEPVNPPTVFIKVPSVVEAVRGLMSEFDLYGREVYFYMHIADDINAIGNESSYRVPRVLYSDLDKESQAFVLMLEDLSLIGAEVGDEFVGSNFEETVKIFKGCANIQAKLVDHKTKDKAWMEPLWSFLDMMEQGSAVVLPIVVGLFKPENRCKHLSECWDDKYQKMLDMLSQENMGSKIVQMTRNLFNNASWKSICKWDHRLDNLLRTDKQLYLIDWQMVYHGTPVLDFAMFMCCSATVDTKNRYQEIIRAYVDEANKAGADVKYEALLEEYKKAVVVMLVTMFVNTPTFIEGYGFGSDSHPSRTLTAKDNRARDIWRNILYGSMNHALTVGALDICAAL